MTSPKFIPYKLRAGEEGYFKPAEMATLATFAEITAFEHAYYFNNCDPVFRDYMLYAGSATGKLMINQPGAIGDYEGTLAHWKDQLRAMGAELEIYGFSIVHKDKRLRENGKAEVGFIVYAESRRHPAQVFYVPMLDAEEVVASGKQAHPMFRSWMPEGVYPVQSPKGWFLLNDEQGNPMPGAEAPEPEPEPEPEFVPFGPVELALRNLGNVLFKSKEPYHVALILSFEGEDDRHVMVDADDLDSLHDKVWKELNGQAEANPSFRGYCLAVDAFLTEEAEARNKVYLVQSEYWGVPATLKGYQMIEINLFGDPIGVMQAINTPPVFERPPVRTLYVQE
jgi:hypothetical protein